MSYGEGGGGGIDWLEGDFAARLASQIEGQGNSHAAGDWQYLMWTAAVEEGPADGLPVQLTAPIILDNVAQVLDSQSSTHKSCVADTAPVATLSESDAQMPRH